MATLAAGQRTSLPSTRRFGGKHAIFTVFSLMLLYVLVHNESFLIRPADPVWNHYQPFKWWLLLHGIGGACALLLGPMQFSDRLRQRFALLHRVVGRIYVGGVLVVAPLGGYIQYFQERAGGPRSFTMAAVVDAALLWMTTFIAFAFILNGKVQQHRQWMTRSFAVAMVFLEVRVITGLAGLDNSPSATETTVWACLAFSVLAADIVIQLQELAARRPKARAMAAAQ